MIALDSVGRKLRRGLAMAALALLAACDLPAVVGPLAGGAPGAAPGGPVKVALLVPGGGGAEAQISRDLVNAARLAVAEQGGVELSVHETGGTAAGAQVAAAEAIAGGAQVFVGPLFAEAANAAGLAAQQAGVSVLAFSNNPAIAGGNVFILGDTFANRANRLTRFAASQGRTDIFAVAARTTAEQAALSAITAAIPGSGARLAGTETFEFSQAGITGSTPRIAAGVRASGANAVFFTADTAGALPLLAELLPSVGVRPPGQQYITMSRLDISAEALRLPGIEGAWFALPDPVASNAFRARFENAYGATPHPLAGLAYDGITAVTSIAGRRGGITPATLTARDGFPGAFGAFRLRGDGTNDRALAVAQVRGGTTAILEGAPRSFAGAGS